MFNPIKWVADTVSKPFRGLGRIVRGDFQRGLGDIFGAGKAILPFVPGGQPFALMSGIGEGMTRGDDIGDILKDTGSQLVYNKVLGKLGGGVPGETGPGIMAGQSLTPTVGGQAISGGASSLTKPISLLDGASSAGANLANPNVARMSQALMNASTMPRSAVMGGATAVQPNSANLGRSVWDKLGLGDLTGADKVNLATNLIGTGANVYGASQIGKAEDERLKWERDMANWEKSQRERDRVRRESLDPVRAQLLKYIMSNYGGGQ